MRPPRPPTAWGRRALAFRPVGLRTKSSLPEPARRSHGAAEAGPSAAAHWGRPDAFAGYKFTGPLRPSFVTLPMRPPDSCSTMPDYALDPKGVPRSELLPSNRRTIPVLEGADLKTIREAGRLGREVLDIAGRFVRAGVTGDDIDRVVWQACQDRGVYPSPLNYMGFPKSVGISPNEVICHGIPDCRPFEEGDIVNLDVTIYFRDFHADLNETFFVGRCCEDSQRVVRASYEALRAASEIIRPGTPYSALGDRVQEVADRNSCAVVPAYCGHGVGRLFHGPPLIPHFRGNKAVGVMKPGHVFTVEPMLNLGTCEKDQTWPDGWAVVTRSGLRSAQFEHTFLVTEDGMEVLTARPGSDRASLPAYDAAALQR